MTCVGGARGRCFFLTSVEDAKSLPCSTEASGAAICREQRACRFRSLLFDSAGEAWILYAHAPSDGGFQMHGLVWSFRSPIQYCSASFRHQGNTGQPRATGEVYWNG